MWYVLLWNLLALGWCLVSVYVWRLLDDLLLTNVLCSQEFSGVLRFGGLSLLPLDFSLILPVASRFLHPYSTDRKTSRLVVKRFSTMRDTQRGSQSCMKRRRGRKGIEVSRRRRRGIQEKRDRSRQYSVP